MNKAIELMMQRYDCRNNEEYENALKEILQEVALLGLSRSDFFSKAAFYGGTALRIFQGLPRYSEDLDFSLDHVNPDFDISEYLSTVERELLAYGFKMTVRKKDKTKNTAVQSAFIKGNTIQNILEIAPDSSVVKDFHPDALIKIKFEIDTNPPAGANFQYKYSIIPENYRVRLYDMPSLFSGKIHAVLCRSYKQRVKGRDYFDYIWYLRKGTPVNLYHLQKRMEQSGKWDSEEELTLPKLKELLKEHFKNIDYRKAVEDVEAFLPDQEKEGLKLWSADFFIGITDDLLK